MPIKIPKQFYVIAVNVIMLAIGVFVTFYVAGNTNASGYNRLYLLPLTFTVSFLFVFSRILFQRFKVFIIVFTGIGFARFVVLPYFIVFNDYYGGRSPEPPLAGSMETAIYLMVYELIVVTIVIGILDYFQNKKYKPRNTQQPFDETKSYFGYVVFIVVAIVAALGIPNVISSISFFIPKPDLVDVMEGSNVMVMLGGYMFILAKQLVFIMVTWWAHKRHRATSQLLYVWIAIGALFANIGIFIGTNRSDIVLVAIVSLVTFRLLFPKYFKLVVLLVVGMLVGILLIMSTVRNIASISGGTSGITDFTDNLQVYFGGPYNVAMALETKLIYPEAQNWSVLFFDIFRPMIGVNMLVKDLPFEYSNIFFNQRYFYSDHATQILPMIGQGNLFFGYLLSPLLSVLVVCLAYFIQSKIDQTRSIEMFYFLTLVCTRMGMLMGQNTMNIINDLSYNLALFLIVYYVNRKIVYKKRLGDVHYE
ncbi:hypothetical protein BMT55_09065 [Listeria newyorkensis]|uniref:Oligosaccharide repeat unit polymerase n=1 Tax=Listeria newyorkensis TaxID=1497681 RepID=A0ABX4XLX1_9LIST|nr:MULTISPECIES: hypothetical protein [Listeria]KGL46696.1 hypothetical protein EP56_00760 [Listeriaceae bacterium FSL A5-0209]KGL37452.1 hypothetical protein EP58_16990 [Listeria newyorkensis]PNP92111.1 hypothetical protein BMT55_09065 [Listeria newyorkensis]RQW65912.1 hypothetical protein DUK53_13785 [Listeria sp. SHR_NRA_18]WAO23165.1 hypothetical protein OTR81_07870 [Listeria newyorkensis]